MSEEYMGGLFESHNSEYTILDHKLNFHRAPQPMNIVWERLHFTKGKHYLRLSLAILFVSCVIFCGGAFVKYLDNNAYKEYNKYSIDNCPEIQQTYTEAQLQQEAGYYYERRTNEIDGFSLNTNTKPPRLDMISCFCNLKGYSNIYNQIVGKDVKYKYVVPETKEVKHIPICHNYVRA